MADSDARTPRTVTAPVERARIEALIERGRRSPKSYLLVSRVLPSRRQEKLATFGERRDGRIVVDWEVLRREYGGEALRFQLRERGQVLGTAQWHVPPGSLVDEPRRGSAAPGSVPGLALSAPTAAADNALAATSPEVVRLREDLAAARAEATLLAEEARRLRTDVERERVARVRGEAERDLARQAEAAARAEAVSLRERLHEAALDRKESEIAFRLLGERAPLELRELYRIVTGRDRKARP